MEMMKLESIMEMWNKDSPVDESSPQLELIKIPVLHSRYARQMTLHSLALKSKNITLAQLKKAKYVYYSGKMSDEELKERNWVQNPLMILRADLNVYIDGDADVSELKMKIAIHEEAVVFCGLVIKELTSRTYQLREFIEFCRYQTGGVR